MLRRTTTIAAGTALAVALAASPAAATHVHGRLLPDGSCVLLAADGGEKEVQLPDSDFGPTRSHPLHEKVHLGVPGTQARPGTIFVAIGDDGQLTAAALEMCVGGIRNAP